MKRCAARAAAFRLLAVYAPLSNSKVAVRYGAVPEEAEGEMVSGTFFSGLGVDLPVGRSFSAQDETDHAPLAVLSYNYRDPPFRPRYWHPPAKPLYVNGVPMAIIGISAEGFEGLEGGGSTDFDPPAKPSRTKRLGKSSRGRQALYQQSQMVVPALDRPPLIPALPEPSASRSYSRSSNPQPTSASVHPSVAKRLPS